MLINELNRKNDYLPLIQQQNKNIPQAAEGKSFTDTIKEMIEDTNTLQIESGEKVEQFIKGEPVDIHDVMIASQKARTSFQLLLELRNKGLDLYREITRMQI